MVFPIIPDLKYDGPVGFPGVRKKVDISYKKLIKGQNNEIEVLKLYSDHGVSQNLNLKIFHDVFISPTKLSALNEAFSHNDADSDWKTDLEIDIIVVSRNEVCLTEVKSKPEDGLSAIMQLETAEKMIKLLFRRVGISESSISITKVLAIPGTFSKELRKKLTMLKIVAFDFTAKTLPLAKIWNHKEQEKELKLDDLIAALAFLRSCPSLSEMDTHEQRLRESLLEGAKGSDIANHLTQQKHLKKLNHPSVEKKMISQNMFLWLDPLQAKILSDKNPYQVIIGPASSGKTIMIQLKILEILRNKKHEQVLIILPSETLKLKYEEFFSKANLGQSKQNIKIVTAREDFLSFLSTSPHIFIDEFCASATISEYFLKQFRLIKEKIAPGRFLWISADFRQNLENARADFSSIRAFRELHQFSKTYLVRIHRCTNEVLDKYLDFCGPLLIDSHPCHQYEGKPTAVIRLDSQNSSDEVKKIIDQQQKKYGWELNDAVIVIVPNHPCMVSLYLQLKEKCPDVKIHFENETLSNEWPLVVACSSVSEENEKPLHYVTFSRAIFQLILVAVKVPPAVDNKRGTL